MDRITSYNVCYTKLLREPSRFIKEINPVYLDWPAQMLNHTPDFSAEKKRYADFNFQNPVTPHKKPLPETKPYSPVKQQTPA